MADPPDEGWPVRLHAGVTHPGIYSVTNAVQEPNAHTHTQLEATSATGTGRECTLQSDIKVHLERKRETGEKRK